MDRIINLPSGIIKTVLCLLPIKEAVRTSILSTGWRYRWIQIPKLAFFESKFEVAADGAEPSVLERTFYTPSERKEMTKRCKLFYAIYQVLLMHQGPIHKFALYMEADGSCVEIDHILLHLSKKKKNTVRELRLDLKGKFKIPLSVFSLDKLMDLYLAGCTLDEPSSFNGFGSLTTLHLEEIWIIEKALLRLLSNCPSLKRLTLDFSGTTINIRRGSTIEDFFKCLPVIEYLSVWFHIVLRFGRNGFPKELPTPLIHFKHLKLFAFCFRHKYGLPFVLLLIRSSPNLEKLTLLSLEDSELEEHNRGSFTLKDHSDIKLEHLKELEIVPFRYTTNDWNFVKLILAKSLVLKKVLIFLSDEVVKDEVLRTAKILLSFPCVSSEVKVHFNWLGKETVLTLLGPVAPLVT